MRAGDGANETAAAAAAAAAMARAPFVRVSGTSDVRPAALWGAWLVCCFVLANGIFGRSLGSQCSDRRRRVALFGL